MRGGGAVKICIKRTKISYVNVIVKATLLFVSLRALLCARCTICAIALIFANNTRIPPEILPRFVGVEFYVPLSIPNFPAIVAPLRNGICLQADHRLGRVSSSRSSIPIASDDLTASK